MIYFYLLIFNVIGILGFIIVVPLCIGIGGGFLLGGVIALRNLKELFVEAHQVEK